MGLAVGIEEGQSIETLVVLGKAAQAQAEGGDALLCEELALLFSISWEPLGEGHWLPWGFTPLLPIPQSRYGHWGLDRNTNRGQGVCSRFLDSVFCSPEAFCTLQGLLGFSYS